MIPVDGQIMLQIAPHFSGAAGARQAEIINEISPVLQSTLASYEIDTRLRIAHFLGQTCHESAGFRTTEEFASGKDYEGRHDLGNVNRGDGPRYKGRGLLQLTGRANYHRLSQVLGVDLESNPLLAGDPKLSLRIACEYWKSHKINADCDRDDIVTVTRKINGGTRGLPDRRTYTARVKAALARVEGIQISGGSSDVRPVLHRGSSGSEVGKLQGYLSKLHFPIAIDEDFAAATELAVMQFQSQKGVTVDGIVGPETWDSIEGAAKKAA